MTVKTITSLANPIIKKIRSLEAKKYRDEGGLFIVEGQRHIDDALAGGFEIDTLLFTPEEKAAAQAKSAREYIETTSDILGKITHRDNAQGMVAAVRQHIHAIDMAASGIWIAVENLRDPGNLGTIIRTADAAGAAGILLIGNCCDPWSPECVRATVGSFARVKIAAISQPDFVSWKKSYQGKVIGTHLDGAVDYRAADYNPPLILVMGSEQSGLSAETAAACDQLIKIPMAGGAESLNVAVAAGVALYEVFRNSK